MGQSYVIAAWRTCTSGIMPKSSEKGVSLTVISVSYKIITFLPTTGESTQESSSVLEVEADVDDAEIICTALICCKNAEVTYNKYLVSTSSPSSLFRCLLFNRWRSGLVV